MARKTELTLVAAKTPKLKKRARRDWSKAKAAAFLGALAETCNVSEACRQSGVSSSNAYARRKSDAAFRAGWLEAIGVGYQRLELMLLERAFNGTEKLIRHKDGSEERITEYSDQLGLALLKMHGATALQANHEPAAADVDELRERLLKKFERLKRRLDTDEAGGG